MFSLFFTVLGVPCYYPLACISDAQKALIAKGINLLRPQFVFRHANTFPTAAADWTLLPGHGVQVILKGILYDCATHHAGRRVKQLRVFSLSITCICKKIFLCSIEWPDRLFNNTQ